MNLVRSALRSVPVVVAAGLALAACRARTPAPSEDPSEIAREIIAADNERDLDTVLSFYADSAVLLPPNESPVRGKSAIRERYRGIFAASQPRLRTRVTRVWQSGRLGVVEGVVDGQVILVESGETQDVDDKYLMVLEWNTDDGWKIVRLIWSSNRSQSER